MPSNSNFSSQHRLFKAYDIRGDRQLFTVDFISSLSHAFAKIYTTAPSANDPALMSSYFNTDDTNDNQALSTSLANTSPMSVTTLSPSPIATVVIGHDVRHLSLDIAKSMAQTLIQYNIKVIWLGLVTTPIMAFWANKYEGHGIIATASHSEGHINGIKWLIHSESPSCQDIQAIYHTLNPSLTVSLDKNSNPSIETHPLLYQALSQQYIAERYNDGIYQAIANINTQSYKHLAKRKLVVVIDCLNGATAPFAQLLFEQCTSICHKVHVINNRPDPNFLKGNPNPTEAGRLAELQHAVIEYKADIGLSFDGDGDRLAVVDNLGRVVMSDDLLYLLAQVAIEDSRLDTRQINTGQIDTTQAKARSPSVIFDVKCSHHLSKLIEQLDAIPVMSKTGSSIMRRALQSGDSNAIFAGELSGHYLFNDGYFLLHDDAMYAGLRLLNWLTAQHDTLGNIINALPTVVDTPDVYLPIDHIGKPLEVIDNNHGDNNHNIDKAAILTKLSTLCGRLQRVCVLPLCNDKMVLVNVRHSNRLKPQISFDSNFLPADTRLTCIDGIRLDFANGFGIVRPSNTSHSLTVRFAGNTLTDLLDIQAHFVALFKLIDPNLAHQIANIAPNR